MSNLHKAPGAIASTVSVFFCLFSTKLCGVDNLYFREVFIRAGKTFVQSFLGVFIPELCMVLSKAVPDASFWTVTLPPLLCAALAAAISAAWNIVAVALSPSEQ